MPNSVLSSEASLYLCMYIHATVHNVYIIVQMTFQPSVCVCFFLMIVDRYRALRSVLHQIKFVDIQCELLQVFLSDLRDDGERMASQEGTPLTPQFCAHVNASNYIASVLREWGEMKVQSCMMGELCL